jgi:hypothetical protein
MMPRLEARAILCLEDGCHRYRVFFKKNAIAFFFKITGASQRRALFLEGSIRAGS